METEHILWLAAGVLLVLLEAFGVPGIGLFFAGLGALAVGIAISFGLISAEAYIAQFTLFFVITALWAAILWKPLRRIRHRGNGAGFSNMVGDTAIVGSHGLQPRRTGEVTWSGTIMRAELVAEQKDPLYEGDRVKIIAVKGVTLIVKPK